MKIYNYSIFQSLSKVVMVMLSIVLLTACDDFLDVKPTTELDRDELFRSERGYVDALTGVYTQMAAANMYGRDLTIFIPDALAGYYSWSDQTSLWTSYTYKHDNPDRKDNSIAIIDAIWDHMYNNIANLNALLGTIDENRSIFSGDNYNLIKGEALGLHAFLHFELLRMFAPSYAVDANAACIPFSTELTTDIQPLLPTKEIMGKIISELEESRELMRNDPIHLGTAPTEVMAPLPTNSDMDVWHNRRFRFNYYAVVATLARVYLWEGNKEKALACAKEIIADQEKRFPWVKTENLTYIGTDNEPNQDRLFATEHIFAMNVPQLEDFLNGYTWIGATSYTSPNAPLNYDIPGSLYFGKDIRSQYLIGALSYYNVSTKYTQNEAVNICYKERVPMIRVSEMYYIAAECEPNPAQALKYLETVRQHRGLSDMPLDASADLQSEIANEYRKEFLGEGQLWYYLKRTNSASIPNGWSFTGPDLYTFDRPEKEDTNANR
ncbi:MAG: RagB/SusD family nutrient uptake outer membrane protein [Prevotella sp.]|nr:RagB/SusD family nutrient uptake outer membrane protein [Prevotella sp.]